MKPTSFGKAVLTLVLSVACGSVLAQPKGRDLGKLEFEANGASCHGLDGKGVGPLQGLLRRSPTDLTVLARNKQGVFPLNRL